MPHVLKRIAAYFALFSTIFTPLAASAVTVTTELDGTLVKGSGSAIYFYGSDHKRYVFPNDKIFFTWYSDFSSVQTLTDEEIANMPIGGNVTYRPGTKLVKITTDPKVYAVSGGGILRWIISEALAKSLYGDDWAKQVQDVPDSLFTNYGMGDSINNTDAYHPETERNTFHKIWNDVSERMNPGSVSSTSAMAPVSHTIVLTSNGEQTFSWTDSDVSPLGYKFIWSKNSGPTYPARDGDNAFYLPESSVKSARIFKNLEAGTYYVRICVYLGGKCGDYSNEVVYTKTGTVTNPNTTSTSTARIIRLFNSGSQNFYWTDSATSTYGYKLLWSKTENATYPPRSGDNAMFLNDLYGTISVDPGTYFARVCAYIESTCVAYSNNVKFTKQTPTSTNTSSTTRAIRLINSQDQTFYWTDSATSTSGYKLVWSKSEHPTYPTRSTDSAMFVTGMYSTISVEPGTYYVRVCGYVDGGCNAYSNQVKITRAEPASTNNVTTTTPRILTLSITSDQVFYWYDNASSTLGYRLVWSKNEQPVYPSRVGDYWRNIEGPLGRSTTIAVDPGTYYVRVCVMTDSGCGTYSSNQLKFVKEAPASTETETGSTSTTPVTRSLNLVHYSSDLFLWTDSATSTPYALIWSTSENPTYPVRDGDFSQITSANYATPSFIPGVHYYARLCAISDNVCSSPYSNQISFTSKTTSTASILR